MFTADFSEGWAVSRGPGAGHSRAVPSGGCRTRAPPTRGTLTAWLAASAWGPRAWALHPAALEVACGRGAPDPQRPARAGRAIFLCLLPYPTPEPTTVHKCFSNSFLHSMGCAGWLAYDLT